MINGSAVPAPDRPIFGVSPHKSAGQTTGIRLCLSPASPPAASKASARHLIKDRMDITGARWGPTNAEAVLKLRAPRSNGDFNEYMHYHLTQEQQRIHQTRYRNNIIPQAA